MATATVFDPWTAIGADEFRERQARARRAVADGGFDAAVVYSRGGACVDQYADVLYLTGHYSQQPYVGRRGRRRHGALPRGLHRARRRPGDRRWSTSRGGARTWWWPTRSSRRST